MEDFNMPMMAKIDNEAPNFDMPYYDPISDEEGNINLEELD